MFSRRHTALLTKLENTKEELEKAKRAMPKSIDYEERAESLEKAIQLMRNPEASATDKNNMLKYIIERIDYHGVPLKEAKRGENSFTLNIKLRL